jgi:hypothetical protein
MTKLILIITALIPMAVGCSTMEEINKKKQTKEYQELRALKQSRKS